MRKSFLILFAILFSSSLLAHEPPNFNSKDNCRKKYSMLKGIAKLKGYSGGEIIKFNSYTGLDQRTILSGISKYYSPDEIINKKVMVLINLKPRKMMGFESEGMLLLADDGDGNLSLMQPDSDISDGAVIA